MGRYWSKAMQTISLTDNSNTWYSLLGQDYQFGTQSKDFLIKAYGANPYVFMVIDRIAQRLVHVDKLLMGQGDKQVIDANFETLIEHPNVKEDFNAFLYRAAATYLASGECFIVQKRTLNEQDQFFVPINYNVIINQDTKGNVINYRIGMFGVTETYLTNEVLHIQKPDITIDTNRGFSSLRATRVVWESNNAIWSSEASLHKNKGITGVLFSDGNRPMTDPEQKDLQDKYEKDYTGITNFGKVKISTAKLGYIPMGMNPNDLKSIESRLEHLRTVCASFNVDSKLFGDATASTYNNMAEAQRAFIINAVLPLSVVLLPPIVEFLASRMVFRQYYMVVDENSLIELQITKEQKSARIGREVLQGILTQREAREVLYPELAARTMEVNTQAEQDVNTVAQAALRSSSEGVNGILAILSSVMAGTTTRQSAIIILMQVYGFTEQTANEILGNGN